MKTSKQLSLSLLFIVISFFISTIATAARPVKDEIKKTGNGGTVGNLKMYQLNIIGIKSNDGRVSRKDMEQINGKLDLQVNNGRRLFVRIDGKTRINLSEGDFQVLDHDGTDGKASFRLPSPGEYSGETGTISRYSVESRILGKKGGSIDITPCADLVFEDATMSEVCSVNSLIEVREGQSKFSNVTSELLYLHADTDGNGETEAYPLFSQELAENMEAESAEYFWDVNSNIQFKLLQLRFFHYESVIN